MLADPSFGQDVPQPIGHEHVVWDVHPASGELDTQGFGDGPLWYGRMKRLARGALGLAVLSEDMQVTAKAARPAPWPSPGHHSGGERCLLVVLAARHRDGPHFLHGLQERASLLDERPGAQHQRAVHPRVDVETDGSGRVDLETVLDAATQHLREGTTSLWQQLANEQADEQSKKGSAVHPSVAQVKHSCSARASFLGWLTQVPGSLSRHREIQRLEQRGALGAEAAAHAAWEDGGVPARAAKEESHTRARRRRAIFGSAGGAFSTHHNA